MMWDLHGVADSLPVPAPPPPYPGHGQQQHHDRHHRSHPQSQHHASPISIPRAVRAETLPFPIPHISPSQYSAPRSSPYLGTPLSSAPAQQQAFFGGGGGFVLPGTVNYDYDVYAYGAQPQALGMTMLDPHYYQATGYYSDSSKDPNYADTLQKKKRRDSTSSPSPSDSNSGKRKHRSHHHHHKRSSSKKRSSSRGRHHDHDHDHHSSPSKSSKHSHDHHHHHHDKHTPSHSPSPFPVRIPSPYNIAVTTTHATGISHSYHSYSGGSAHSIQVQPGEAVVVRPGSRQGRSYSSRPVDTHIRPSSSAYVATAGTGGVTHNYAGIGSGHAAASVATRYPSGGQAQVQVQHVHAHAHGHHQPSKSPRPPTAANTPLPPTYSQSHSGRERRSSLRHHHHHHSDKPQVNNVSFATPVVTQPRPQSALANTVVRPTSTRPHVNKQKFDYPTTIAEPGHITLEAKMFAYSKCTGRKKAVCIGINYRGKRNELRGCINDANNVRNFLLRNGYKSEDILLMTDAPDADPRCIPTRKNILSAMKALVQHAGPNDSLFFHYSGHGGQVPDKDGDEVDGWDEVIFPLDYKENGYILDDEMHDIMVKNLPKRCRLTALFDSCHSGTVLDLPYIYSPHGRLKSGRIAKNKHSVADVISWSGCADDQTSADTFHGGVAVGAMSQAFIQALDARPKQTYLELFRSVRHILSPRYKQKPQLGSSHHIDTTRDFVF